MGFRVIDQVMTIYKRRKTERIKERRREKEEGRAFPWLIRRRKEFQIRYALRKETSTSGNNVAEEGQW